jgi:hypothetical protein
MRSGSRISTIGRRSCRAAQDQAVSLTVLLRPRPSTQWDWPKKERGLVVEHVLPGATERHVRFELWLGSGVGQRIDQMRTVVVARLEVDPGLD